MKKLVCLLLMLCLTVLVCSGCGSEEDNGSSSGVVSGTPATMSPSPSPAQPQTAKALRVTADSGLNVRAEASTDSEILGLAENGSRLALMVEDPKAGWYQIQYEGETAFVSADYVEVIEVSLEEYNQLRGASTDTGSSASQGEGEATPSPSPSNSSSSTTDSSASSNAVDTEDGE